MASGGFFISFLNPDLFLCTMGKKDKIQMPSSGAGITRYFDDYKSKVEFKPEHVIIMVIIVIIIIVILHLQGGGF